ncbi:hypothetical protein KUV85_10325 [Nocardioides panacisoli]|uniref:hypothetical protein n=1 Tax=Nocardioides panacisoli TaxID=627624 RepID=UPI001C636E25|nr:hypothetical protein [Nocardioides panacisoli]QYJ02734.1 hypothetical protein KUV85_10325 [Nocardioides panacisoli]
MTSPTSPSHAAPAAATSAATPWRSVIGAAVGLAALLTVLLAAFAWPASEYEPRDFPLAVAGPPDATAGIEQRLAATLGEDAIDVTTVADRAAAVAAIEDRSAYGALVVGAGSTEVLTATGAGAAPAQFVTQVGTQVAGATGSAPTVTDVVPTADGDPRGSVFAAGALPLAIGGILIGAVTSLALPRIRDRLLAAALAAALGALGLAALLQFGLDAVAGSYAANAGVIALGVLAVALPIIGLRHLIGPAGIGVVALAVMLIGNPLSGVATSPHLIPLGSLGQLFPPGAVGSALRSTSYFDGAGALAPVLVLCTWAVAGLGLALLPRKE